MVHFSLGACTDSTNKEKVAKMYQSIKKSFKNVPELKVKEVQKLKAEKKVIIIDVRPEEERRVSVIPGAISKNEFEKNPEKYKNKKIAVYCTIGYRSAKYVQKLKKKKLDAYNLEGSILGWVHEGQPVVSESGKQVKKVHVYGKRWDFVPDGYEGIK